MIKIILFVILQLIIIAAAIIVYRKKYSKISKSNSMLKEILQEGFNHSSLAEASQNILNIIKKYYEVDYVTIYVANKRDLNTISSNVNNKYINTLERYTNELIHSMSNFVSKSKIAKGGSLSYPTASEREVCFSSFTPLHWNDELIGAILIENKNAEKMSKAKNRIILYDNIIENIALILQNVLHYDDVLSELLTDELTEVYNRRFINETIPEQIQRHRNLKLPFVIAVLDIDFFKKFNDTYGHQYGDTTLKQVSNYIKRYLKENDWIARFGGEEFIIFLSKTNKENGYKTIDNIREGLSKFTITDGKINTNVTASFGIAELESNIDMDELIKRADKALYVAKEQGRNKVVVYDDSMRSIELDD